MTSYNNTNMERQLSSLFRAEARDAHLPQGTWQAISPRMGEPERLSLFWQIGDAFSFPRWRNPMKVKYAAPAATVVLAIIVALLFILLVNDDADDSDSPEPAVSPTVPVQPTEPPPTVDVLTPLAEASATAAAATVEAAPTATPTATAEPTATPLPESKPLPGSLRFDSAPLDEEELLSEWTEYLSVTEIVGENRFDTILTFCEGGAGFIRNAGDPFDDMDWMIRKSGEDWNQVSIQVSIPGQDPTDIPQRFSWSISHGAGGLEVEAYDPVAVVDVTGRRCTT